MLPLPLYLRPATCLHKPPLSFQPGPRSSALLVNHNRLPRHRADREKAYPALADVGGQVGGVAVEQAALASAKPSSTPISSMEKPMDFRYTGITGYSISLATSVNRLTSERIQTLHDNTFMPGWKENLRPSLTGKAHVKM